MGSVERIEAVDMYQKSLSECDISSTGLVGKKVIIIIFLNSSMKSQYCKSVSHLMELNLIILVLRNMRTEAGLMHYSAILFSPLIHTYHSSQ